jgi:hypothetical protein
LNSCTRIKKFVTAIFLFRPVTCSAQQITVQERASMAARPEVTGKAVDDHQRWLDEIVGLPEGAMLRKVSVDTLKREHKRGTLKIIELSPKRRGITRREALSTREPPDAA